MQTYDVTPQFQGSFATPRTATRFIAVHHAAALYRQTTGLEDVQAVARYHLSKGWGGIGYQQALAEQVNGGPIARYLLSDLNLQRAHIAYRNHEAVGIACLTNFDAHPNKLPETKWVDALVLALIELQRLYPTAVIVGHREIALSGYATACPGTRWQDWKPDLLRRVRAVLDAPLHQLPPAPPLLSARYKVIERKGATVRARATRKLPDGKILGSLPRGATAEGTLEMGQIINGVEDWLRFRYQDQWGYAWLGQFERIL